MSIVPGYSDDSFQRESLLREIGLPEEVFLTALEDGDAAAARCTSNHPPMTPGFYRFAETVKSLAEQVAPLGWVRRDFKNFSTVVRPDDRVAIAVASGNDGTGDLSADVTTRSPKGAATEQAVDENLSLPLDDRYVADNARPKVQTTTWFLLHARRDGQLLAELSRPKSIVGGYVQVWEPRIPLRMRPMGIGNADLGGGEPLFNPDVEVKKRDF